MVNPANKSINGILERINKKIEVIKTNRPESLPVDKLNANLAVLIKVVTQLKQHQNQKGEILKQLNQMVQEVNKVKNLIPGG
ncbi:hypothetical protein HX99_05745 [Peptococcaceae bacterium SCADC1_2_3]|nr:hypothetical protein DK28_0201990 [Peptococcaceae bacterium SCADC1_2_3]KFI35528.1 hypothetical protein HX99_05745 [Peptococcaceae bacterium SCADC1_2_3]KFI35924.1 hypothetical protein HY00_10690 [Peptococcaceae bacterium SCADC1_2_3]HBQ29446.1 hypothetical protein [Desulfotomaculum sp.]HCJ79804.1 hypothetical protein [Desulfotomaculum sp.]